MSIIIRLQNLPWSANSSDIRYFFRGLEIPEGGVHIIGGDKGDAFIAFQTDEDARLAMQKDGLRLKGNYVKLILSSRSEMKQLIEIARGLHDQRKSPDHREERARLDRHNSQREISPETHGSESYQHLSVKHPHRNRSSSPHRSSGPPSHRASHSNTSHRSSSSYSREAFDEKQSKHRESFERLEISMEYDHVTPRHEKQYPEVKFVDSSELYNRRSPEVSREIIPSMDIPPRCIVSGPDIYQHPEDFHDMPRRFHEADETVLKPHLYHVDSKFKDESYGQYDSRPPIPQSMDGREGWTHKSYQTDVGSCHPDQNKSFSENTVPFCRTTDFNSRFDSRSFDTPLRSKMHSSNAREIENYCVKLSGFPENAKYMDVQATLKNIYAPMRNIKWDVNSRGYKSGAAYVRLSNVDDFNKILSAKELFYDNRPIRVSKCPDDIFYYLFLSDEENDFQEHSSCSSKDFCYVIKGLPYATTEDDVINFFTGFELADMLILYGKNGKATGTGFVQFSSLADYKAAYERNGKKIGHRYIELLKASQEDIDDARRTAVAVSKPMSEIMNERMYHTRSQSFKQNALEKRPLCVVLSGLPSNITTTRIFAFFKDCGIWPDAVHIVLNENTHQPSGRAFAEFLDLFDLDVALKQHGKFVGDYMVSIKQMLFEEMMNILDTHSVVHDFGVALKKLESSGPLPEKLPYIWEPPDTNEDMLMTSSKFPRMSNNERPSLDQFANSKFYTKPTSQEFPNAGNTAGESFRPNFDTNNRFERLQQPTPTFGPNWSSSTLVNQREFSMRNDTDPVIMAKQEFTGSRNAYDETLLMQKQHFKASDEQHDTNQFASRFVNSFMAPHPNQLEVPPHPFSTPDSSKQRDFFQETANQSHATILYNRIPDQPPAQNENWSNFRSQQNSSRIEESPFMGQRNSFPQPDNFGHPEISHFNPSNSMPFEASYSGKEMMPLEDNSYHPKQTAFNSNRKPSRPWKKNKKFPVQKSDRSSLTVVQIEEYPKQPLASGVLLAAKVKNRTPIKFGVKTRQSIATNETLKAAFDPTSDNDDNKQKLKKLSPEKVPPPVNDSINKMNKPGKEGGSETKTKDESVPVHKSSTNSSQKQDIAVIPIKKVSKPDKKFPADDDKLKPGEKQAAAAKSKAGEKQAAADKPKAGEKQAAAAKSNTGEKQVVDDKPKASEKQANDKPKASEKRANDNKPKVAEKRANEDKPKAVEKRAADVFNKGKNKRIKKNKLTRDTNSNFKPQRGRNIHSSRHTQYSHRTHDPWIHNRNPEYMEHYPLEAQSNFQESGAYKSCTVQVSGVPPYCGIREIMHFFSGFNILAENIIRRYTNSGEPTGDVRVTFINAEEAEQAVELLNHESLVDVPVVLFIV